MDIYEAIRQMKIISDTGNTFSFSFMSYSYDKDECHGVVTVEHAKLISTSKTENNRYADYMMNYIDMDTLERKHCWQLLLLEFNGTSLELN